MSIQIEREAETSVPSGGIIDMGITRFATLSDGSFVEPIHSFKRHQEALRKAQQALSRKVKFSRNWLKAKRKIQKRHHRIANMRRNFLHQTFSQISQNHAMVYLEDLQVRNISKSAKGNSEQHGKQVKQKFGLNLTKGGQSFAANWITNWRGTADISLLYRRRTPVELVQVAATCRKTTDKLKPSLRWLRKQRRCAWCN